MVLHYQYTTSGSSLVIQLDSSAITFRKIPAERAEPLGNVQLNFPVNDMLPDLSSQNILDDHLQDLDDHIFLLLQARRMTNDAF